MCCQALNYGDHLLAIHRAKHRAGVCLRHAPGTERQDLVQQRQRITQAAVSGARQQPDRGRLGRDALGLQDVLQATGDQRRRQPLEIELQAARQHGDRQFLRVGRCQQELDVGWRLLERLQQRIE